jgi:hypothetical protein
MEHYKNYVIDPKPFGRGNRWEPRFSIYSNGGNPTELLVYRALHCHDMTNNAAAERALAAAKKCIDDEL